jgi:hypothetical protein
MINALRLWSVPSLIGVAMLLNGCDRDHSVSTAAPPATTAPVSPARKSPEPVADHSLPASEYISLGMPSYDREWIGQDMAVAAAKLQALAAQSPGQLPRFGSKRSGPMFARIVARDNLKFFRSRSLPLASRFPQSLDYFQSLNAILKVYLSAREANQVTGEDMIELVGAQLRAVQVELELVDEFVPTLSKDDPKYPVRMAGLDQMRRGLAQMVSGVITTLTEKQAYDVGTRAKLVGYCRETFPSIVPKLSAPSQQEMLRRVDELVDDSSIRDLRPQLISLHDEVHAAIKSGG